MLSVNENDTSTAENIPTHLGTQQKELRVNKTHARGKCNKSAKNGIQPKRDTATKYLITISYALLSNQPGTMANICIKQDQQIYAYFLIQIPPHQTKYCKNTYIKSSCITKCLQ